MLTLLHGDLSSCKRLRNRATGDFGGLMTNFMSGLNVGGWISQYFDKGYDHFDEFIREKDIEQIASWGFDHIRLPVDYEVLEKDDQPFTYIEKGFSYLDNAVAWCRKYGISVLIDLHSAPGFKFSNYEKSTLFSDRTLQDRYIKLWETIAKRYKNETHIAFDLLNEIVLPSSDPWNSLATECVSAIRAISPDRLLIIGGNNYNSIFELTNITIHDDPNIAYTFHFYEPILFTHQKAGWMPYLVHYNQTLNYPGAFDNLDRLISDVENQKIGNIAQFDVKRYLSKDLNRELMIEDVQPALDFITNTGRKLYCGEYGVIESAPMPSRVNWTRDAVQLFEKHRIGRAYWTYKGMDFGILDHKGNLIGEDIVKALTGK